MYEQLVFARSFSEFIINLFNTAKTAYLCSYFPELKNNLRALLCVLVEKFFLEIESHVSLSSVYFPPYLYQGVYDLFYTDKEHGKELMAKYISEPEQLLKLLVKCPEQEIRKIMQMLLLGSFKAIEEKGDKLAADFINLLIGFIGTDLYSHWRKFKELFELLKEIILTLNQDMLRHFIEKDLVAILLDFFLEKHSPLSLIKGKRNELGGMGQFPDFTTLMEIVAFLVVHSDMPISPTETVTPPTKQGTLAITLPELSMKCLSCKELLPKYFRSSNKVQAVTAMLVHLSYRSSKFTRQICEQILKGINSYDATRVLQYIDAITLLLLLEDNLSLVRTELILGFSQPNPKSSYGLSGISDIEDDVNIYISPVSTEERNKPLLQLLWEDKRRFENVITQLLKMLFAVCEGSARVYRHVRDSAPPSYMYARYTDWVEGFLEDYGKMTSFMSAEQLKEKEKLVESVKELWKRFDGRVKEDGVKAVQLYMIGKTISTKELDEKEIEVDKVKFSVTEVVAEIYESEPMVNYNSALPGKYLINHFNHMYNNANTRYEKKMKGVQPEKNCVDFCERDSDKSDEVEESKGDVKERERARIEKELMEQEDRPKGAGRDSRSVKPVVNNFTHTNKEGANIIKLQGTYIEEGTVKREESELESSNNEDTTKGDTSFSPAKNEPKEEAKSALEEPKIIITPSDNPNAGETSFENALSGSKGVKFKAASVIHRMSVVNNSYDKKVVTFSIRAKKDANFYCPVSSFKFKPSAFLAPIFFAQADDASKPIGDYEVTIKVKNLEAQKANQQEQVIPDQGGTSLNQNFEPVSDIEEISCVKCTVINPANAIRCFVCDNLLSHAF